MSQVLLPVAMMTLQLLLGAALMIAPVTAAPAKQTNQTATPISAAQDKGVDDKHPFSPIEDEMKAKRAIKYADKEYQENLDRARDLSSLGDAIVTSFKQNNRLDSQDTKKLEKLEKLAKSIRRAAGGSDDDYQMEKPPENLTAAIDMLSDLSQSLKEKVEDTPKHVISAAVIDEANALLELIQIIRRLPR